MRISDWSSDVCSSDLFYIWNIMEPIGRAYGRVIDLLELFASTQRGLALTEISKSLDIPKSSAWLMLQHLTERRLLRLVPETKKYEIGSEFISLALKVSSATNGDRKSTRLNSSH